MKHYITLKFSIASRSVMFTAKNLKADTWNLTLLTGSFSQTAQLSNCFKILYCLSSMHVRWLAHWLKFDCRRHFCVVTVHVWLPSVPVPQWKVYKAVGWGWTVGAHHTKQSRLMARVCCCSWDFGSSLCACHVNAFVALPQTPRVFLCTCDSLFHLMTFGSESTV